MSDSIHKKKVWVGGGKFIVWRCSERLEEAILWWLGNKGKVLILFLGRWSARMAFGRDGQGLHVFTRGVAG